MCGHATIHVVVEPKFKAELVASLHGFKPEDTPREKFDKKFKARGYC